MDSFQWRKASASNSQGACIELAPVPGGALARDSRDPRGPVLSFTSAEMSAFLAAVKSGQFDSLAAPGAGPG